MGLPNHWSWYRAAWFQGYECEIEVRAPTADPGTFRLIWTEDGEVLRERTFEDASLTEVALVAAEWVSDSVDGSFRVVR